MILFRVTLSDGTYGYMEADDLSEFLEEQDDNITVDILYVYEVQKGAK